MHLVGQSSRTELFWGIAMRKVDPKVEEAIATLNMRDGPPRRKLLGGAGLVSASAAAAALLTACGSSSSTTAAAVKSTAGNFPSTPAWQFWFVSPAYSHPFFVPIQYGFRDAAALLHIPVPKWGGSADTRSVPEMVSFLDSAIAAKANGIATTVISSTGFTDPVAKAMKAGIPVVTYNADGTVTKGVPDIGTNRLCYVGQALYDSGIAMGNRIKSLITTPGHIVIFITTPGTGNLQPRCDGAASVLTPAGFKISEVATGATNVQEGAENSYIVAHKPALKGAFAADAGSTVFLGPVLAKNGLAGKIPAGGFDLLPGTLAAIKAGQLDFTIDQSPYLQGFLPTLYLYLFNLSGGLVAPPNTDTGLTIVTKATVDAYLMPSRFEGSTAAQKMIPRSGSIINPMAT
jgi:simple sugar transport system substrate-binding protein